MSDIRTRIKLCIHSQAKGGRYEDADCYHQCCPMSLSVKEGRRCPCRTRMAVGRVGGDGYKRPSSENQVRVIGCLFPQTWHGEVIRNPAAFGEYVRNQSN